MNQFVYRSLCHFLMGITDGEGNDLSGTEQEEEQEQEEEIEEEEQEEEESGEDDVVVTIAGEKKPEEEEEQAAAPKWVKELRQQHREAQKTIRELKEQLKKPEQQATQIPALGKKPAMEDDDIDWDAEKFEQRLTEWHDRKREIDQAQHKQQEAEKEQKTAWSAKLESYATAKSKLKVKDYDDAEAVVMDMFDQTQQGIIIDVMDNPAHIVYALGKNKGIAEKLAALKNPTKFLRELSRLEDTKLKVQTKKTAPPPEKTITGTGRVTGSNDSQLERLRAEAERTGDMSKVMQYKRDQKRKAAKS
jgi:DNA repair exonuclease SbcCD ATPase subunit